MTTTKQCCGNCHWWNNTDCDWGECLAPMPSSSVTECCTLRGAGKTCPTFRRRGERLPQRFRVWIASAWDYGICWPMSNGYWSMQMLSAHGTFADDPAELINVLFGDAELEWIDNDYGWKDVTA